MSHPFGSKFALSSDDVASVRIHAHHMMKDTARSCSSSACSLVHTLLNNSKLLPSHVKLGWSGVCMCRCICMSKISLLPSLSSICRVEDVFQLYISSIKVSEYPFHRTLVHTTRHCFHSIGYILCFISTAYVFLSAHARLRNLSPSAFGWCRYDVPLVADIHFQPVVANMVAECFEKIRINPGNFVDGRKRFDEKVYDDDSQFKQEQEHIREVDMPSPHPRLREGGKGGGGGRGCVCSLAGGFACGPCLTEEVWHSCIVCNL